MGTAEMTIYKVWNKVLGQEAFTAHPGEILPYERVNSKLVEELGQLSDDEVAELCLIDDQDGQ